MPYSDRLLQLQKLLLYKNQDCTLSLQSRFSQKNESPSGIRKMDDVTQTYMDANVTLRVTKLDARSTSKAQSMPSTIDIHNLD